MSILLIILLGILSSVFIGMVGLIILCLILMFFDSIHNYVLIRDWKISIDPKSVKDDNKYKEIKILLKNNREYSLLVGSNNIKEKTDNDKEFLEILSSGEQYFLIRYTKKLVKKYLDNEEKIDAKMKRKEFLSHRKKILE